jgi:hypothetical protein
MNERAHSAFLGSSRKIGPNTLVMNTVPIHGWSATPKLPPDTGQQGQLPSRFTVPNSDHSESGTGMRSRRDLNRFCPIFHRFAVHGSKKCLEFRPANKNFNVRGPRCGNLRLKEGVKPRTDREGSLPQRSRTLLGVSVQPSNDITHWR